MSRKLGECQVFDGDSEKYNLMKKQYREYLDLYKFFNKGSIVGVVPFPVFYWRMTFQNKYLDASLIGISNQ